MHALIIREMQIKSIMGYHLILVRMASSEKFQTINTGEGMNRREPSYTVGGREIGTATMENSTEVPQ